MSYLAKFHTVIVLGYMLQLASKWHDSPQPTMGVN